MNSVSLSTRDRAIAYLYGMKDGTVLGGISPFPYCPIAQNWMLNYHTDRQLVAMRRSTPEGNIETAFEFPEHLFSNYAIDQVGFAACLEDITLNACGSCIFRKPLPNASLSSLVYDEAPKQRSSIDLKEAAQTFLVEYHNQDFAGKRLCEALVRLVSFRVIVLSDLNKRGKEVTGSFPAIVINANPHLEPLMFDPRLPLENIANVDFETSRLKAGKHRMGKR